MFAFLSLSAIAAAVGGFILNNLPETLVAGVLLACTVPLWRWFISTPARAAWLEEGARLVYEGWAPIAKATPGNMDNHAAEYVRRLSDWAREQGRRLTELEKTRAEATARLRVAQELAAAAALAPVRAAAR